MRRSKNILIAVSLLSLIACGKDHHNNDNVSPMPTLAKKGEVKTNVKGDTITLTDGNVIKENKIAEVGKLAKDTQASINVSSNYDDNVDLYHAGMVANGNEAKAINDGVIISNGVLNRDATEVEKHNVGTGMISENEGTSVNNGVITGKLATGMSAYGDYTKVINNGEIKDLTGEATYNSLDSNGNIDEEKGIISEGIRVSSKAYGMNGTKGKITGKMYMGMYSKGQDSKIENLGEISLINPQYNVKSTKLNNNTETQLDYQDEFYGMKAKENSEAINTGKISMSGSSLATGIAMYADNSNLVNNGEINLNSENQIAMMAISGSKAINNGTINLNAKNGVGLYATENSQIINGTKGEIYLSGTNEDSQESIIDSSNDASKVQANFGKDSNGNVAMKIEEGSTMVNKGKIIFKNN